MSFFMLLITLTALIFVHEVGHLVAARLIGVRVRTISIGFGGSLCSYQDRTGTLWKLSIFPLGGYVKLHEDNSTNLNFGNQLSTKFFNSCSFIEKSFVALAGPFANITFAFFLIFSVSFLTGYKVLPIIGNLGSDLTTELSGLEENDEFVAISGLNVNSFNEIDSLAMQERLDTSKLIQGISADHRIGSNYNNPSFAYGGYCLPKDVKQLNSIVKGAGLKSPLISSITSSNLHRVEYICQKIIEENKSKIGIFRLEMKKNSDNFRESAILKVAESLQRRGIDVVIYEPNFTYDNSLNFEIQNDFQEFAQKSELIVCNRWDDILIRFRHKVFTRDIYNEN